MASAEGIETGDRWQVATQSDHALLRRRAWSGMGKTALVCSPLAHGPGLFRLAIVVPCLMWCTSCDESGGDRETIKEAIKGERIHFVMTELRRGMLRATIEEHLGTGSLATDHSYGYVVAPGLMYWVDISYGPDDRVCQIAFAPASGERLKTLPLAADVHPIVFS